MSEIEMKVRMAVMKLIGIERTVALINRNLIINPLSLLEKAVRVKWINVEDITLQLIGVSEESANEIEEDYRDSGEGIGSSDMNSFVFFMMQGAGFKMEVIGSRFCRVDENGKELIVE